MSRAKYGEPLKWLRWCCQQQTDKCLIWPFSLAKNGYALVRTGRKRLRASRAICLMAHGPAPSIQQTDAAHSCGVRACCNPKYIYHATSRQNQRDKIKHGTVLAGERNPCAKLKEKDVLAIRDLVAAKSTSQSQLARKYGVSANAISLIVKRVNWASL